MVSIAAYRSMTTGYALMPVSTFPTTEICTIALLEEVLVLLSVDAERGQGSHDLRVHLAKCR